MLKSYLTIKNPSVGKISRLIYICKSESEKEGKFKIYIFHLDAKILSILLIYFSSPDPHSLSVLKYLVYCCNFKFIVRESRYHKITYITWIVGFFYISRNILH